MWLFNNSLYVVVLLIWGKNVQQHQKSDKSEAVQCGHHYGPALSPKINMRFSHESVIGCGTVQIDPRVCV